MLFLEIFQESALDAKCNLEWLFRVIQEPKRLFKKDILLVIQLLLKLCIRRRRHYECFNGWC